MLFLLQKRATPMIDGCALTACIFMSWVMLSILYWAFIVPTFVQRHIYKLDEIKHKLFWAKMDQRVKWDDEQVRAFEDLLITSIANASRMWLTFGSIEDEMDDVPNAIGELHLSALDTIFNIMALNSPWKYLIIRTLVALGLKKYVTGVIVDNTDTILLHFACES